ncbi:MAG TPA: dihydroorotate dehydrogenase [Candidatus Limnocylindria bacterium]|jgi:dihydroorotate dehydrogenase (NAD+) catalytic subunit|nr:dihydroorotate dehydrogenase [Candidatus Limnocylindria bacterium]
MPWRRPKKQVERPIDVRRSLEESLETAAEGEEEDDLVELVDLDGASIAEAAAGEPDAERTPTEIAEKLRESLAGAVITEVRAVPHAPPETLPEHGVDLSVEAARGLWLKNPVLTASGTFGQGVEYAELIDVGRLGAIVNKGTTPRARPGNPQYRIAETPAGILNSIGLENPGAEEVARKYGKAWAKLGVPVIVNVAGYSTRDYVFVVEVLDGTPGVIAFELNVSCPNVEGGMLFGSDPGLAAEVTRAVKDATDKPVIVKLTPNAPKDVIAVAQACEAAGADGLTAINTVLGMRIDVAKRRPILGTGSGGLSGPAIRPIALHLTYQVAQAVSIPIIGAGGVTNANDALEFLMAGASAVQVGTATFADPTAPLSVIEGLAAYVRAQGLASIRDIVGAALPRAE